MSHYTGWLTRFPVVVTSTPTEAELRVKNSPDEVILHYKVIGNSGDLWKDTICDITFLDRERVNRVKVPYDCYINTKRRALGAMSEKQREQEEHNKNRSFDLDNSRLASDADIIEAFADDWG